MNDSVGFRMDMRGDSPEELALCLITAMPAAVERLRTGEGEGALIAQILKLPSAHESTSLQSQVIKIDRVARISREVFGDPNVTVISGCAYAYGYDRLSTSGQPWHWRLIRASLIALQIERNSAPVIAAYEMLRGMIRLFLCSRNDLRMRRGVHETLSRVPGFMEAGASALSVAHIRPVAYWEPPSRLVALWPLPVDDRPGPYALDAGSVLELRSYPEADHEGSVPIDEAGFDYMRVPSEAEGWLEPEGIRYENRWAVLK